jgi:hypothetical protein
MHRFASEVCGPQLYGILHYHADCTRCYDAVPYPVTTSVTLNRRFDIAEVTLSANWSPAQCRAMLLASNKTQHIHNVQHESSLHS